MKFKIKEQFKENVLRLRHFFVHKINKKRRVLLRTKNKNIIYAIIDV